MHTKRCQIVNFSRISEGNHILLFAIVTSWNDLHAACRPTYIYIYIYIVIIQYSGLHLLWLYMYFEIATNQPLIFCVSEHIGGESTGRESTGRESTERESTGREGIQGVRCWRHSILYPTPPSNFCF